MNHKSDVASQIHSFTRLIAQRKEDESMPMQHNISTNQKQKEKNVVEDEKTRYSQTERSRRRRRRGWRRQRGTSLLNEMKKREGRATSGLVDFTFGDDGSDTTRRTCVAEKRVGRQATRFRGYLLLFAPSLGACVRIAPFWVPSNFSWLTGAALTGRPTSSSDKYCHCSERKIMNTTYMYLVASARKNSRKHPHCISRNI